MVTRLCRKRKLPHLGSLLCHMDLERRHRETAISRLVDEQYVTAGDRYSRAGWAVLGAETNSPFAQDERSEVGTALARLTTAALCYRVGGATDRATARSLAGEALTRDLRRTTFSGIQRAVAWEFIGDFRVVAGRDVSDAYERAREVYETEPADDPLSHATTPLFESANEAIIHASRHHGDLRWDDLHGPDPDGPEYLTARPKLKAVRFPEVIDRLLADGRLHVPRGTTEHNSDQWVCPACGQREVNWIGGVTVCLECSTRLERQ